MGRKGVSKRKPRKSGPSSGAHSMGRSGERSPVESLVKDKGSPLNRDGMHPSAGSNKAQKKH